MARILYRLVSVDGILYLSFYDSSKIGNSKNFEIDIPERLSYKVVTQEEYDHFLNVHLFPQTVDAAVMLGDFDFIVLAEGNSKNWITSFVKEVDNKWVGHLPNKILRIYQMYGDLMWLVLGFCLALLVCKLLGYI